MTGKAKNTAIVLGGAVALSFGAYALGTQTGGGSASATSGSNTTAAASTQTTAARPVFRHREDGPGRPFGPALGELADDLGVSTTALRSALEDVRQDLPRPELRGEDHLKEIATALGVSEAKLRAALEKVRPERGEHHDELAAALADKLGIATSKVEAALERRGRPGNLAQALGVSEAKLRQAFESLREDFHGERHDEHAKELADALGISQAKVEAAFEKLRAAKEKEFEQLRDQFAAALAKRLNVSQDKVEQALDDLPKWGMHRHRHP
jgi:biotin operon repressor